MLSTREHLITLLIGSLYLCILNILQNILKGQDFELVLLGLLMIIQLWFYVVS